MKLQLESLKAEKFKALSPNMMSKVTGGTTSGGDGGHYDTTIDGKKFDFASDCYEYDSDGNFTCEYYDAKGNLVYLYRG